MSPSSPQLKFPGLRAILRGDWRFLVHQKPAPYQCPSVFLCHWWLTMVKVWRYWLAGCTGEALLVVEAALASHHVHEENLCATPEHNFCLPKYFVAIFIFKNILFPFPTSNKLPCPHCHWLAPRSSHLICISDIYLLFVVCFWYLFVSRQIQKT